MHTLGRKPPSNTIAAFILGIAVLGGSYLISRSLDDAAQQLDDMRVAMVDMKDALRTAPARPAAAARRRRGPDPNVRHTTNTKGAPVRGAKIAKVTIVEIADFQ